MSDEREPLWSDTRIEDELRRIGDNMRLYIADAATVAEQVRDDYEARITELEQERIALWHTINTQATYAEELEAQLAQCIGTYREVALIVTDEQARKDVYITAQTWQPAIPPDVRETIRETLEWRKQWMKATGDQLTVNSIDEVDAALTWLDAA